MKTLAFFFAMMVPVLGRIGETKAQCAERYGSSSDGPASGSDLVFYKKNGIGIQISFAEGRAESIYYSLIPTSDNIVAKLSDIQIQSILTATEVGGPWKEQAAEDFVGSLFKKNYVRGDGKAFAEWAYPTGTLTVETLACYSARLKRYEQDAARKVAEENRKKQAEKATTNGL